MSSAPPTERAKSGTSQGPPLVQLSEAELLAHRKVRHFGQVPPIEDVEAVIDTVDSITRLPCGCRYLTTGKTNQRYCFGLGVDKWGILGRYPDAASSLYTSIPRAVSAAACVAPPVPTTPSGPFPGTDIQQRLTSG